MSKITQNISDYIKKMGIQISVISKSTGISGNALYKSFSGKRHLLADELLAVCDFLGKSPSDFR